MRYISEQMAELISFGTCAETIVSTVEISNVLFLYLVPLTGILLIILGLSSKTGFIVFLGGLLMLISSLFLVTCANMFAYALVLMSIVLIMYSVIIMPFSGEPQGS